MQRLYAAPRQIYLPASIPTRHARGLKSRGTENTGLKAKFSSSEFGSQPVTEMLEP